MMQLAEPAWIAKDFWQGLSLEVSNETSILERGLWNTKMVDQ